MRRGDEPINGEGTFGGLTIREHLAGLAMQGLMVDVGSLEIGKWKPDVMARTAVRAADALLAALAADPEEESCD